MPINPFPRVSGLEIPTALPSGARAPEGTFANLASIGDAYGQYRRDQQAADILQSHTDANGNLDFDRAGADLTKAGLPRYAELLFATGARRQALQQTAAAQTSTERHQRALEAAAAAPTFGVVGEDLFGNKQHGWIDRQGRTVTPYGAEPGAPPQQPTITLSSGEVITVPPGQDPKKFREHITAASADAAAGKFTEVQSNAQLFANRMENAEPTVGRLTPSAQGSTGAFHKGTEHLPFGGEWLQSPEYQQYSRAKLDWITAQLRKESGAAINKDEYIKSDKTFFPQPGDDARTIADKAEARRVETAAMIRSAGPGYRGLGAPGARTTTAPGGNIPPPPPGFVVR